MRGPAGHRARAVPALHLPAGSPRAQPRRGEGGTGPAGRGPRAPRHSPWRRRRWCKWSVRFVDAVVRTNFFLPVKSALSFRLAKSFFSGAANVTANTVTALERVPFGVFFVVGRDFHGFHVRFKDIARGGIRLLHSATYDEYHHNADSLFEECYNLAFTQNKKNKDIPEGGSKGIILPAFGTSRGGRQAELSAATSTPCSTCSFRRAGGPSSAGKRRSCSSGRTRERRISWTGRVFARGSGGTATGRRSRPARKRSSAASPTRSTA